MSYLKIVQITPTELKALIAEVFDQKFREIVLKSPESQYLNYKEVCEITKLTRATVYKFVKTGKLKAYKIGSKRLFKLSDVKDFVEKN